MSALLKDVITIPDQAGAEDYVLRLTDSIGHAAARRTIDDYVVTPALTEAFDQALGLVSESIGSGVSRGAFLAGSFGSGKSHFMAVLHALLRHEPAARAKQELQQVIAKHDAALRDRTILPLAFHLLGAKSLEQALFEGYLRQIRELHPDAPLPAIHKSDALFHDADALRRRLGDEAFFAGLNQGAAGGADAWAAVLGSGSWDSTSYAQARAAAASSEERLKLVSALVETYFSAYTQQAEYVDLDTGLAAIATHAKGLGYDAVALFLDELVLWLAFSVQEKAFFSRESQKLTKLVESSTGSRAIPLVSFVARQMDLRRWFADSGASGAEQEALDRAFKHQEGRFSTVVLGDDNLPFVANRRLLQPKDDEAREVLEDAFRRIDRNPRVWDVLLDGINTDESHRGADEKAFRLTYPFSPALVSTLRSLASVMQRERTALKVMQQMLVDQRESLTVDSVIPVGDSFDYIVQSGGNALDPQAAALFRSAGRLYTEKLHPLLRSMHNLTERQLREEPETVPAAYGTDDRLAKTLLLSAVAPNVPALKSLTAARLAALNHGSVVSPLPGGEATVVLAKVRTWARDIPEIHLDGADTNPTIRVQLSDVDHESIVERAKGEDNEGRRRELVKTLVAESLGIELGRQDLQSAYRHEIIWRGSKRQVDLLFGNVRDAGWLSDDHFRAAPGTWRVVIDHPFDEPGHSSAEDQRRLEDMTARDVQTHTLVWLPRFLSDARIRDLRRLVILTWLLEGPGDRWQSHADHLNEGDRALARNILESNRNMLRRGLEDAIQQAYGAASVRPGTLVDDAGHTRTLVSLDHMFAPQAPVGATLGDAFRNLLTQAFDATYPGHPRFEPGDVEVRVPQLKTVAAHVHRAMADKEKRVELQGDQLAVRRIAGPLGVGTASEMHYIIGDDRFSPWSLEIEKALGRRAQHEGKAADDPVTVGELRRWIDEVTPAQGLDPNVSDLVIITWAALRQRAWYQHGSALPAAPDPGSVQPSLELRPQPRPRGAGGRAAGAVAAGLLGIPVKPHLTAPAVADLVETVTSRAAELANDAPGLVAALEPAYGRLGLDASDGAVGRLATARTTTALVQRLRHLRGVALVQALAEADLGAGTTAAGTSLASAGAVTSALTTFQWSRLNPLTDAMRGEGRRSDEAAAIVGRLQEALVSEEFVTPIGTALERADDDIFRWLEDHITPTPAATPPTDGPKPPGGRWGRASRPARGANEALLGEVRSFLDEHADADVEVTWQVRE
ncbi:MAG: DUF6079 family protein [Micrococcales bacterium]|nr:DUF6079 family protein [Micrococcales bacterium]